MPEPQAYLNGRFVPAAQAVLPAFDAGFVQGTTVAEQLRTFGGRLFRLEMHLERLFHSLAIVEVDPGHSCDQMSEAARELVAHNHALLADGDDLGLAMFVTPGEYPAMISGEPSGATVCLHTFPLRFELWADRYLHGESLATTDVEQVSPGCWPPELKCRSRMHYYLADRQARKRYPGSRALMLDRAGYVIEATSANVVLYRDDVGLLLPPAEKTLPGISLAVLLELAEELEVYYAHRDLKAADVAEAREVFLTSTSPCMVPVVAFNGRPIGDGRPGPVFARFMSAWNELVGLDVVEQAQRFAIR
jgi:branched-subunit amino acid aminotransferase/4-amino-4-deoxychorismate lyase